MERWLVYALLALVTWGFWGFFPKVASNYLDAKSILVWEVIGAIAIGLIVLFSMDIKPSFNTKGVIFSILTGIAGTLGMLFFLSSIAHQGKISIVVVMTALYPVISLGLAYFILNEPITLKQWTGIFLAFIAMALCAT